MISSMSRFLGAMILFTCLALVHHFESSAAGEGIWRLLHWPAMLLTGVGPMGVVLLCSEWTVVRRAVRLLRKGSPARRRLETSRESNQLHHISQSFYAQGSKAFESARQMPFSPAYRRAIQRLAMRMPILDVAELLERERLEAETRIRQTIDLVSIGVRLAPSVGMLGTILGMVRLLTHLSDQSALAGNMGLALLTTFFGLFFSIALWTPLQHRLEAYLELEMEGYERALHWLDLLDRRKPANYLSEAFGSGDSDSEKARPAPLGHA